MFTDKRLTKAYKNAKRIPFNDNSKFVFFSDVHRGDNSMSDEFAHNQNIYYYALSQYFKDGYTYVEVGDGDELWEHHRFKHIRFAHSDVFCLLSDIHKAGRLIMLYGNHNIYLKYPSYVEKNLHHYYDEYTGHEKELFPGIEPYEAIVLKHEITGQEIFVVHGHQGDFMNDLLWRPSMFMLRYFWRFMHIIGFQNPASPAKNRNKRHKIEKNYNKWNKQHNIIILCGHTHRPKFPAKGELPYFNTGCCIHPRGITGIEIAEGHIMMVDFRVRPNVDGRLFIRKNVIRGPEPLYKYANTRRLIEDSDETLYHTVLDNEISG